jgi:Putative auto-transporter adhesin, head GIN domain
MKKLLLSFLVITIGSTAAFAQKVINDVNVEKRTVGSFHGIEVSTGIELTLTEGNTEEVAVSASTTEFRDKIVTEVKNGILKIHYETKTGSVNKVKETKGLKAYVSYKTLDALDVNTGAEVKINGVLKSSSLNLNANTGGLVNGEVDIAAFKVSQNTGSKITLSGKVEKLEINGDTGSKFNGEGLSTSNCSAKVSTGAGIYITVQKELNVKANTGGFVKYKGEAGIRDIKTNTGGHVSRI